MNSAAIRQTPLSPRCANAQNGFVLVATIFALAVMAVAAAYFAGRVDLMRTQAGLLSNWAEAERDAFSSREVLIQQTLISVESRPGNPSVKSLMSLDGRRYRLTPSLEMVAQDERGLLSIALADEAALSRLLGSLGVSLELRGRYRDVLNDYIDPDDLRRLNGAERNEYHAAGLVPPPNDFPRGRDELLRMLVWRDLVAAVEARHGGDAAARFLALFSASRAPGINLNSAPAPVLAAVGGINPARVSALIDQRNTKAFASLAELAPYTNGPLDSEFALLYPGISWRVSHIKKDLPFLLECRVTFTPLARDRPARVSECQRRSRATVDIVWDKQFASIADPATRPLSPIINTARLSQPATETTARADFAANESDRLTNPSPLVWISRHLEDALQTAARVDQR